jgi:DNA polymerase-4
MKPTRDDLPPDHALVPWAGRAVLHVDMDAFFASVEQLDHPEWRGRPVVVGGSPDSRGVIAAASYEARAYGVRSAMPAARAARLLPSDAVWARGDFARYGEVSAAVFKLFESFTPEVQGASIDEAYLDVTPGPGSPHPVDVARAIQASVDAMGVSCSIGVATNKTTAKIASDRDKPHGITVVPPGTEAAFLAPLAVGLMPGIGPATAARLTSLGIRTLGELASLDDVTAVQVLGSHGIGAVRRASGVDGRPVREREPLKSVSNERTFGVDIRDRREVRDALAGLAERVAGRLRRKALCGRTVHVKVRYGDFTTRTAQSTVEDPTDSTDVIMSVAERLLDSLWAPGVGVRLLGIGVTGFGAVPRQMTLPSGDEAEPDERRRSIDRTVDQLRERFGPDAVRFGSRRPASRDPRDRYGPPSGG